MEEFKIHKKETLFCLYDVCSLLEIDSIRIVFNIDGYWRGSSKEIDIDLCDISAGDFDFFECYYIEFIYYRNKKEFIDHINKIEKNLNNSYIFIKKREKKE